MNTAHSDETTDTADLRDGDAPDVTNDSFDRLAEEFAARCRRGESPSVSEYAAATSRPRRPRASVVADRRAHGTA